MTAPLQQDPSLLDQIIASHGALSNWNPIKTTTFKFNFSGAFLAHKGYLSHYQPSVLIQLTTPRTEITGLDLTRPTDIWIWTPSRVWIQDAAGNVMQSREEPRKAFEGHTRDTKWDSLHLTYFLGYALWNYSCIPFAFFGAGFETREGEEHWEPGYVNSAGVEESWRVLEVTFPEGYHAHTRKQRLYFDRERLWIRRMDYVTDVAGGVAAHYCFEHKVVGGIVVPTFRRVVLRIPETGKAVVFGLTAFMLDYFDIGFAREENVDGAL